MSLPHASVSQPPEPKRPGSVWAHAKYWSWKGLTVLGLGPIYCSVIAEGLRLLVPALGQKLHKLPIPGFSHFGRYEETRRLDLAIFMAVFLLFAVWWLWEQILRVILSEDDALLRAGWKPEAYQRVVLILGVVILSADSALFYLSVVQLGWGGTRFSAAAAFATAAYLAVIVFVSLVSLNLRKPLDGAQQRKEVRS